jgi:hypothetical protein
MLSNFPVWLFDADKPYWPTIGLKFIEEDPRSPLGTLGSKGGWFSMVDYARRLVDTMMEAHDRLYLEESDFHRTIAIDPLGEVDLVRPPRERALELYASGRGVLTVLGGGRPRTLRAGLPCPSPRRFALTAFQKVRYLLATLKRRQIGDTPPVADRVQCTRYV